MARMDEAGKSDGRDAMAFAAVEGVTPNPGATDAPGRDGGLPRKWARILNRLEHAFQPIVNSQTGLTVGQEALLRNTAAAGFPSIEEFFDQCHAAGVLPEVEFALADRAVGKFITIAGVGKIKLFLNFDNRTLARGEEAAVRINMVARKHRVPNDLLVVEISERHPLGTPAQMADTLSALRRYGFGLAIDDFGAGFSGLQLLYAIDSDLIKFDRFFIHGIAGDAKKRLFLAQIIAVAHLLGIQVIAEGVETEQDYLTCRDLGCEVIQGYLVERPVIDASLLRTRYTAIEEMSARWKHRKASDEGMIREQITAIEPIAIDNTVLNLFERFRANKGNTFFPVVDRLGVPLGIIREENLKDYTYSHYGRSLIENRSIGRQLHHFVTKCPVADINLDVERILENFAADKVAEGIIVVDGGRYIGFLPADALLRVLNEKRVARAQDQNPLTKLPGNLAIYEFVQRALGDTATPYLACYFDFDNFKPFNDKYGFRVGDRAILLFSEMMTKSLDYTGSFIGHIGGDDFFFGLENVRNFAAEEAQIRRLLDRFSEEVVALYDEQARADGFITAVDRSGTARQYPLLGVSAGVINFPSPRRVFSVEEVSGLIAVLKKSAKASVDHLASTTLTEFDQTPWFTRR